MTVSMPEETIIVSETGVGQPTHSYVDWPAIIAGVVLASAILLVLVTFGSAVGLSFSRFDIGPGFAPIWVGIVAAIWLLCVEIASFAAGGYVTGRMRRRIHDASEHESDVRDGVHGLLVWAGALVVGGLLAFGSLGAAATSIGNTLTSSHNEPVASGAASPTDPNAYFVDQFFRPASAADKGGAATSSGTQNAANPPASTPARADTSAAIPGASASLSPTNADRDAVSHILMNADNQPLANQVSEDDKAYLTALVARVTGMSNTDASARVDKVLANVKAARQQTADTAETARKVGILAAFLTAAALLIGSVGAFWAASIGGRHRDEGVEFTNFFRRY